MMIQANGMPTLLSEVLFSRWHGRMFFFALALLGWVPQAASSIEITVSLSRNPVALESPSP